MSVLSLDLNPPGRNRVPGQLPPTGRHGRLTYELGGFWFPRQGFLLSLLIHEIALVLLVYVPFSSSPRNYSTHEKQWELTMLPKDDVLLLPALGGRRTANSGKPAEATAKQVAPKPAAAGHVPSPPKVRTEGMGGVTYVGKQEIVSNPPNYTNHIQTILRPDLPNPPTLKEFRPLLNFVSLSPLPPAPAPPQPVSIPKPVPAPTPVLPVKPPVSLAPKLARMEVHVPLVALPSPQTPDAPQLKLPSMLPSYADAGLLPKGFAAPPAVLTPRKPSQVEPVIPAAQGPPNASKAAAESVIALSPNASASNPAARIPDGEMRGQFAVSPEGNPKPSLSAPGPGAGGNAAGARGTGIGSAVAAGGAGNSAAGPDAAGPGKAGESGPMAGSGLGNGIEGGAEHGGGSGVGSGVGSSPAGHGSGAGGASAAGLSILGGEGAAEPAVISTAAPASSPNRQLDSYGMTIISTGNSGGGIGDFGVFVDEAVFTVYLSPDQGTDDPSPPWPLQYSILGSDGTSIEDLLPPFATKMPMPEWPNDLSAKYQGQQVVVSAIIGSDGKMAEIKVLQSPDPRLSEILITALKQWVFRPAVMNGKPAALKALLAAPIPSPRPR